MGWRVIKNSLQDLSRRVSKSEKSSLPKLAFTAILKTPKQLHAFLRFFFFSYKMSSHEKVGDFNIRHFEPQISGHPGSKSFDKK